MYDHQPEIPGGIMGLEKIPKRRIGVVIVFSVPANAALLSLGKAPYGYY